ncbi:ABC transporter permease subunit [soil metagenome]
MTWNPADFFHWLNEAHSINFSIFYDAYDRGRFLRGMWTTLELSGYSIVLSVVLGVVAAWLQQAPSRVVRALVAGYVQVFRNTPQLVQLAFFYFGVSTLLPTLTNASGQAVPLINNFGWAVISLSLFSGAFNAEIFRAGIEAVPSTTVEAAESLGYSRIGAYVHVILPLALRVCLPALTNNLIALVKLTSLAYAIGVSDILSISSQIWTEAMNVREMMLVMLVVYVAFVAVLAAAMERLERALRVPGFGHG